MSEAGSPSSTDGGRRETADAGGGSNPRTPMRGRRNIVLLSDGTGNSAAKLNKTNVWRLYQALDLRGDDQIAFYDSGVGTSGVRLLQLLGGAVGWACRATSGTSTSSCASATGRATTSTSSGSAGAHLPRARSRP
jgi:hypothetical protein